MTALAVTPNNRVFHETRRNNQVAPSVEHLIRETHRVFDRFGVNMSPGKVIKLVRRYDSQVYRNGVSFADYMTNQIVLTEHQRFLIHEEWRKAIHYPDPTGEHATNRVFRSRGY